MKSDFNVQKASCRFIEARTKAGKTQEQLAAELDINPQTIKNYEKAGSTNAQNSCNSRTNAIAGMKIETLYKAAKLLNVSADYLLGLSDVKSPNTDIQTAVEITGLTERSIQCIVNQKRWGLGADIAHIIDILLYDYDYKNIDATKSRSYRQIINLLEFFFRYSNTAGRKAVYGNGNVRDMDNSGFIFYGAIELDDTIIENAVLMEIQQALINIKANLKRHNQAMNQQAKTNKS